MNSKELKTLKEESEHLRENQRMRTDAIKQIRTQIRILNNSIKSKNQEIASLEAKVGQAGESSNELSGVLTLREKEIYSNAFTRITLNQLFEPIKSKSSSLKNKSKVSKEGKRFKEEKKNQESITSVDVLFEKVQISFFVGLEDTFEDLREQAASYWALPIDEIFFSDSSPDEGVQPLFLLKNNVIKELYVWKNAKMKSSNFLLHLVLRNYTSLKDRMEQLFPKNNETEQLDGETDDPIQRLMGLSKKKDRGSQKVNKQEELRKRKKWTVIQYFFQWAMFLALFFLWTFMISSDKEVEKCSWINKKLAQALLWNFRFDDIDINGLYGSVLDSSFLTVTSVSKMWDYIDNIQTNMLSDGDFGVLENHLYSLQYIEIRQLRTKVKSCDYEGLFDYNCTKEYNVVFQSYEKDLNDSIFDYNTYTSRVTSIFVYGDLAYYPNGGYLNSLNIQDRIDWTQNITTLKEINWIDDGTRAVMISLNFYNPSTDILSMIMPYFEISASRTFVPNFKIYSIKRHPFATSTQTAHAFILLFILGLLILEIRENIREKNEINVFIFNNPPPCEGEKFYDQISEYSKTNFFKRLKRPKFDQLFSLVTLFAVLILEILNLSLYFGYFEQDINVRTGYNNLFGALQGVAILGDAKTVMILFLALNVMRYIIIWMTEVSKFFQVVLDIYEKVGQYIFLSLMPLFMFSVYLYYFLGIFDIAFSSLERSFLSTIRIFCGRWPTSRNFQYFTDSGNLVLIYFVFIIWRALVLSFQAILFQLGLFKIKLKMQNE